LIGSLARVAIIEHGQIIDIDSPNRLIDRPALSDPSLNWE